MLCEKIISADTQRRRCMKSPAMINYDAKSPLIRMNSTSLFGYNEIFFMPLYSQYKKNTIYILYANKTMKKSIFLGRDTEFCV